MGEIQKEIQVETRRLHDELISNVTTAVETARAFGAKLVEVRPFFSDVAWNRFLRIYCPHISTKRCERYMRIARHWDELNAKPKSIRAAIQSIADLAPEERAEKGNKKDLTTSSRASDQEKRQTTQVNNNGRKSEEKQSETTDSSRKAGNPDRSADKSTDSGAVSQEPKIDLAATSSEGAQEPVQGVLMPDGPNDADEPEVPFLVATWSEASRDEKIELLAACGDEIRTLLPMRAKASSYPRDFEEFWMSFSRVRREKKKDSAAEWEKLRKDKVDLGDVTTAAIEFRDSAEGKSEHCPGPLPWLRARRWEDDRESWNSIAHRDNGTDTSGLREFVLNG